MKGHKSVSQIFHRFKNIIDPLEKANYVEQRYGCNIRRQVNKIVK